MPDRSPENPAEHVAPAFVAGVHPVRQEKGHGASVIGQHAEGGPLSLEGPRIGPLYQLGHPVQQRLEQIGVEVVVLALHHGGDPLESGSGVD